MTVKFLRSDFSRNLVTLVSATVVAQVINFAFNIVLARMYSPAQFGLLSVFTSLVSIFTVFSAGKFDVALVTAGTRKDAQRLVTLSFLILSVVCVVSLLLVLINLLPGVRLYGNQEVFSWLGWLPESLFFLTVTQVLWMWNVREKRFSKISWVRIAESLSNGTAAILFCSLGAIGLLYGTLISQFISATLLVIIVVRFDPVHSFRYSFRELKETMKRFSAFPRINVLQGFMDIFQLSAVVLTVANYLGSSVTGLYGQCMRVLQVPMRLIILPVAHVFFSEASETWRNGGDLFGLVKKTVLRTALFASPVPLVLIPLGPWIFSFVFGAKWEESGVYAQLLAAWVFLDLIRAPVVQVASILGKQNIVLFITVCGNIILSVILAFGVSLHWQARELLLWVSASQAVTALILILLMLFISKKATPSG